MKLVSLSPRGNYFLIVSIIVLSFCFPSATVAQEDGSGPKLSYTTGKGFGYLDANSREVIKYQYDNASPFYKSRALVMKNKKWGMIDPNGKIILPLKYYSIKLDTAAGMYYIKPGDLNGMGAIDMNLKPVLPAEFMSIKSAGSVFLVQKYVNNKFCWGVYDMAGKNILPVTIEGELGEVSGGYIMQKKENFAGLMKNTGEIIIPFEHRMVILRPEKNYILVADADYGRYYLHNMQGKRLSEKLYDGIKALEDGYFAVSEKDKWGFFKEGKIPVPCIYDEPDTACLDRGMFLLQKDRKYGLIDLNGKEIVPFVYDKLSRYEGNNFLAMKTGKYGLIDSVGRQAIPCSYSDFPPVSSRGLLILSDDNHKYGALSLDGRQQVPFVVDENFAKTNYKAAAPLLSKLLEADPVHPYFLYLDALGKYSSSKPEEALPYVTKLMDRFSRESYAPPQLQCIRSMIYTDLGKYPEAELDALRISAISEWRSKAYIYIGNRKFREQDFKSAERLYLTAEIYIENKEADELRKKTIDELKKLGQWVERVIPPPEPPAPELPMASILNFTSEDRFELVGWDFKHLYTYNEAVSECPAGYRLPTLQDWLALINYIMKDKRLTPSTAFILRSYIGEGWETEYSTQKGIRTINLTFRSSDDYKLNIRPLRRSSSVIGMSDYLRGHDAIQYWMVPGELNGKPVNLIEFNLGGFEWLYAEDNQGTASVRYVKKK